MFKNYWKTAFRSLWKNKNVTFINVFGLAIGIASSLLIFLFVRDENSYDTYHKDAQNIFRVVKDFVNDDGSRIPDATTPGPLAAALQREIPEIVTTTRVFPAWGGNTLAKYKNAKFNEFRYFRADSSFFNVFTCTFLRGNPKTALPDAKSVVLTESTAKKYFGNEDALGKAIRIEDQNADLKVTAVIKDIPSNSHFHFDFLASTKQLNQNLETNWDSYNHYTYIKVQPGTNTAALNKKIQGVYERNQESRFSDFYVQPLTGIHLTSHLKWEIEPNSDKLYVNIFSLVALFILIIASINYINLATAKSSLRAKEIGVRKVSGAQRGTLVMQFLMESVIITIVSALLAMIIAQAVLPLVNALTQKQLSVVDNPDVFVYMPLAALAIGLVAGLFPSLYLSSFKPVAVLKGLKLKQTGTLSLRKSLVVVQFTISIALIIGSLIIIQQMNYISNAKLGINKENVLAIKNTFSLSQSQRNSLLATIKQMPEVKNAAPASNVFGTQFSTTRITKKGSDKEQQINFTEVGYDFLDVMGLQLIEGRSFSQAYPNDTLSFAVTRPSLDNTLGSIIVNERALKEFGIDSPHINRQLTWFTRGDTTYNVNIVGVVKDFHFTSLRNEIKPFGFIMQPQYQSNITVKLATNDIPRSISKLEHAWNTLSPEYPFEYVFLDETFAKMYASEARFKKVFIILVAISIIISCLGLFALATFSAEQRIKEIGIRKVLGASATNLVALLSRDYLKLILISICLSVPVAWYAMNQWLQDFAYRINIEWWIFIVAAAIAIIIAFATISFQAIKAALTNPVISLKTE